MFLCVPNTVPTIAFAFVFRDLVSIMPLFKTIHVSLSDIKQRLTIAPDKRADGESSPKQSIARPDDIPSPTSPNDPQTRRRLPWIRFNSWKRISLDGVSASRNGNGDQPMSEVQCDTVPPSDQPREVPRIPPPLGRNDQHESSSSSLYMRQYSQDDLLEPNSPCQLATVDIVSENDQIYNLACELYSEERYNEAFALFVQIAQLYSKAAYNCGNMCRDNLGVQEYVVMLRAMMKEEFSGKNLKPQDRQKAASFANISDAEIRMQAAIRFYHQAINLSNHPRAAFNLANIYREKGDISEAIALYKLACKEGHERSWTKLGNIYMSQRKFQCARKCYKKGMDHGHASAWRNMGLCYEKGLGITRSLSLAYEYYEMAAERKAHRANDLLSSCGLKIVQQQTCVGML